MFQDILIVFLGAATLDLTAIYSTVVGSDLFRDVRKTYQNHYPQLCKMASKRTLKSLKKSFQTRRLKVEQKSCKIGSPSPSLGQFKKFAPPGTRPGHPRDPPPGPPPPRQGKGRDGEPIPFDSTCSFLGCMWLGMKWVVAWVGCDGLGHGNAMAWQKASHTPGRRI